MGVAQASSSPTLRAEQSNTSVVYGDKMILKLYRGWSRGEPELRDRPGADGAGVSAHTQSERCAIEYYRQREEPITLAVVHEYVQKEGDAWELTLDSLRDFFDRALRSVRFQRRRVRSANLMKLVEEEPPRGGRRDDRGIYESARLLGQRTAEMHAALFDNAEEGQGVRAGALHAVLPALASISRCAT